jgi:hypothetical protein
MKPLGFTQSTFLSDNHTHPGWNKAVSRQLDLPAEKCELNQ